MAYTSEIDKLERRHKENPAGLTFAPLAEQYRKTGYVARALEVLRAGLKLHPDYISASIVMGRCHLDLGEMTEAENTFRRVLELDNESVIALKALADLTERQTRFDESEHWLNYLLSIDSGNEDARGQLQRLGTLREQFAHLSPPVADAADESAAEPIAVAEERSQESAPSSADVDTIEIAPVPSRRAVGQGVPRTEEVVVMTADLEPIPAFNQPAPPPDQEDLELIVLKDERAEPTVTPWDPILEPPRAGAPRADDFDLAVERHEEFVLRPSSASEYQAANDAEVLGADRENAGMAPAFEENSPGPLAPEFESDAADESVASGGLWQSHPEDAIAASESIASTEAWEPPPPPPPTADLQPRETRRAEPAASPLPAMAGDSYEDEDAPASGSEPATLRTETMGDVFAAQGHHAEALDVYRQLLLRSPGDHRLQDKIAKLETRRPSPAIAPTGGFAASETGGQSVLSYFGGLLSSRLPESSNGLSDQAPPPEADYPGEPATTGFMEETFRTDAEAPASGEPTRPASGPLSLSAIFGEDSSPVPPVVAGPDTAAEPQAVGSSFDQFFGERPAGTTRVRSVRVDPDQDDLEQFHKWLKGLKR